MKKGLKKEVEFLDYIGSRTEPYKYPSAPADSAYIVDQGMTGTLAESIKPVVEEISKVLNYITGFFQWDTDSTVDNDTLTQYRKRPDYSKSKQRFNALLSGWSLDTDDTVGLKPVDLKDFNDQELKDLAIDLDDFIKSADLPMVMNDKLVEMTTTAAIAVPETGMLVKPIQKKEVAGYTYLNESEYSQESIQNFLNRSDAQQILDEFEAICKEYKLDPNGSVYSQLIKRNPIFQKEIISKFDDLVKKHDLTLQNLGLQEAKGKYVKDLDSHLTKTTGLNKDERQMWRDTITKLSDKGDKEEALKVFQSFSYWRNKYLNEDYDYNKAEIENQDKQNFDQSESDRVFLAQLLSSYKDKFPSSLATKLENLFSTYDVTNINNINLDIFSDSFIKTMRGKIEELIKKSGLSVDMFESKEVKAKKLVESYGLIEKEEEEKEEETVYAFKSKNRVIIVRGFDEDQARDVAVKIMAPNDRLPELPEGQYELSYILPGEEELTEAAEDSLKRYIVSFDAYMFAKDDDAIKKAAAAFARKLDLEYDNKASVLEIYENPFGSTSSRKV